MDNFITFSFHRYVVIILVIYPGTSLVFRKVMGIQGPYYNMETKCQVTLPIPADKKITKLYVLKGFLNKVQNAWFLIFGTVMVN